MNTKRMIIVCSDKTRKYGDYLSQLIGDMTSQWVSVVVWSIKDYKSNSARLSSDQYMLFIGNDKLIKEKRMHMRLQYDKYNMRYGWLGHQASLNVGRTVTRFKYSSFIKYYSELVGTAMPDLRFYRKGVYISPAVTEPVQLNIPSSDIREQMYSCLTYAFFVNGLNEFLK